MDESRFSQLHVCEDDEAIDQSERDRLSELPDSLILSILSFLSMFDVVRTTTLSKRWKDLWATIPCLHFCFTDHHRLGYRAGGYEKFLRGALAKWKGVKMLKLSLSFCVRHPVHSYIDSWLLFAIEKQVEELSLDLRSIYVAPQRLYSCSSITKLFVTFLNLKPEDKVQWDNLKSLTIRVDVSLSEDAMNQVFSGAPHLEELILSFREVINENLNIRSTSLKKLKIIHAYVWPCGGVLGIWAPNLVTLDISGLNYGGYSLVVPSLTNAILSLQERDWEFISFKKFNQVFRSISHAQELTLSEWCCKHFVKNRYMEVPLSNAKFLKFSVHEAEEMLDVFVVFPKLMHTIVDQFDTKDIYDALVRLLKQYVTIRMPRLSLVELKTVEITWSAGDASIFRVMEYLLENAHMLEKMVLRLRMAGADTKAFVLAEEKVRSMPRSSATTQLIITKI